MPERRVARATPEQFAAMRRHCDGPAWRWRWAQSLQAHPRQRSRRCEDPYVLSAAAYLIQRAKQAPHAGSPDPLFAAIAAAAVLAQDEPLLEELKILVVGNCPRAEIAARLHLDEKAVEAWELLYYDVRSAREATDWVLLHVIQAEEKQGNGPLAARLKYATAGPSAAKAILDAEARVSLRRGQTLFDCKVALMVKFEQAVHLPLSSERAKLFFLKTHAELLHREKRLRLAEKKLQQRSEEALQTQKRAEARWQRALQRRQERAAKLEQRKQERAAKLEQRKQERAQKRTQAQARKQQRYRKTDILKQAEAERHPTGQRRMCESALAQLCW